MTDKNWSEWLKSKENISNAELNEMVEKTQKDFAHLGMTTEDLKLRAKEHQKKIIKTQHVMESLNEVSEESLGIGDS